jgi:hypothetical protein
LFNGKLHLFLYEGIINPFQSHIANIQFCPTEVMVAGQPFTHGLVEVIMNDFLLLLMARDPTTIPLDPANVVFSPLAFTPLGRW